MMNEVPVLACQMDGIPAAERPAHHERIARLFRSGAAAQRPRDDGYTFEFDVTQLEEVAAFVSNERRCCPFLDFTLHITPHAETLQLAMTGPPGSREFIEAELLS